MSFVNPARPNHTLSKSRYTIGLRCPRALWWQTHEPDAPELIADEATQGIFDQGTRVGELARAYVPGGTLIDFPYDAREEKLAATRAAIDAGADVIYEAAFFEDNVFAAVDILERLPGGWGIIEVKSSTKVKEPHYPDATIQTHILRRSGLSVRRVEIMHLNRECVSPDLSNLFTRVDITEEVEAGLILVHRETERQFAALAGPLPDVPIGRHCLEPYECAFKSRCWAGLPAHHVTTLYYAGASAFGLIAEGFETVADVPTEKVFNPIARRQQRAIRESRMIVEPGLATALATLHPPMAFLDFETVNPAIPVWPGCRPYDQIPVQFSVHVQSADGSLAHHEWLAEPPDALGAPRDPRPGIAGAVVEACRDMPIIVGYNTSFERTCLGLLADAVPELAEELNRIGSRLVDLLAIMQRHVYHPDFMGSLSLKSVLPVLVPTMNHDTLAVSDGQVASTRLRRLIVDGEPADAAERERAVRELRDYCRTDTLATVRLLEVLKGLG
jgi:hypothetical protein